MFLAASAGLLGFYALLAVLIPLIVEGIKKYTNWIPSRYLPLLPPVLGFVAVFLTQLSTGVGFIAAVNAALVAGGIGVGGSAAMIRQIKTKTISNK